MGKYEYLVNLGEGYAEFYTVVIFLCLKLFQKIYLKECRNNFKVLRIILNLNFISNKTIIHVLEQHKDMFISTGLIIFLRPWTLTEIITRKHTPAKMKICDIRNWYVHRNY